MTDDFAVQSPEEWAKSDVGEDDQDPHVVWVAAEDREQARMMYLAYRAADDEYAIQLLRFGCLRGVLRDARKAAAKRPGCQPFRIVPTNEQGEGGGGGLCRMTT